MLSNFLNQILDWFRGEARTRRREWGAGVRNGFTSRDSAQADSSDPAGTALALPLGARFRQEPADYAMTLGQLEELNRLLQSVRPLPQGALKVMQELDQAGSNAASVGHAIECEPVMAASMVRIANSSAIGLRREITSVSEAVAYLGFSTTKSLLLRFNVAALLPGAKPGQGYDSGKLWVHAMAVAQVSEEIARRAGGTDTSLALMAGLLHDIGKLAINDQYTDALDQFWAPGTDPNEGLLDRERRLFRADHAFIGGNLATQWKLPHDLVEIIRLHHKVDDPAIELSAQSKRVLLAVHIANQLVKHRHVYCDGMEVDHVPETMTSQLGLPDWAHLLADGPLRSIIDRAILLNGGTTTIPSAAAA